MTNERSVIAGWDDQPAIEKVVRVVFLLAFVTFVVLALWHWLAGPAPDWVNVARIYLIAIMAAIWLGRFILAQTKRR